MLRPVVVWTLFLLCGIAVITALSLLTQHARALENAGREATAEADLANRTRFALWRMDTSASSLLAVENNRPPKQFSANSSGTPLLTQSPDYALLYFEVRSGNRWSSPQVPDESHPASGKLQELRTRISSDQLLTRFLQAPEPETAEQPTEPAPAMDANVDQLRKGVPQALQKEETVIALNRDLAQRANVVELASRRGEFAQNTRAITAQAATVATRAAEGASEVPQRFRAGSDADAVIFANDAIAEFSPFEAIWMDGELLLCRTVAQNGDSWLQGIWLNADQLSNSLLSAVRDILPEAELSPSDPGEAGPLGLITLPYMLQPGEPPMLDATRLPKPVKGFLLLAWGACSLMLLVAGILLAGVLQLGERRAAFVSSVTHELRTPLTTFRLYAEMLAEKMVPEEDRRQQYLRTLQTEAGRLCHLVENVLAYSRIERGSAQAKVESLSVNELLDRIVPRLTERAAACQLTLECQCDPQTGDRVLETDATAVEQILFNLTDNACKYAGAVSNPARLDLSVDATSREVIFQFRDFGPGVSRKEQRKLFRPFHKSAMEAAHSQPGVGLGLALSRRLAKALGGNLRFEPANPGAQFSLTLPVGPS